jgi:hypothetical protein
MFKISRLSRRLRRSAVALPLLAGCLGLAACGGDSGSTDAPAAGMATANTGVEVASNPTKVAYFGDLHVHTELSFDAYLFGTRRTPNDAYEFAKGGAIEHASGFSMQMKKPLDFLGVSDHGFYLGMMRELAKPESSYKDHPLAPAVRGANSVAGSQGAFAKVLGFLAEADPQTLNDADVTRAAWQEVVQAAEKHNTPGEFTAFIAYEYTSSGPEFQNLHRNVIFRGSEYPAQPFTRLDSLNPEDLWDWMDTQRANGIESLAIPHNSNGSDGWMFPLNNWAGDPIDASYAEQRMRNEPLVENTQVKGTSDTHPLLSPNDEWADFEIMPIRVASTLSSKPQGSYVREAYLNGLRMEQESGVNPYKFGVIGSSDTHNAAGSFEEDNYWSKTGVLDIEPQLRGSVPLDKPGPDGQLYANGASQYWGGSGLAGVWAESNTRDAIYAAFRRKETFSTSGPHIKLRFFGGFGLAPEMVGDEDNIARLYKAAVPMGSDLLAQGTAAPSFFLWASRDVDSGPLQRLQVIKGWVADGETHEQIYDVACSDGGEVDPKTHRCPDNGARVELSDCSVTPDKGAAELRTLWQDPDFAPGQRAIYYARVLENPICRWSTWDAIRAGVAPRPDMHKTIQDRAWSSPIWYLP